LCESNEKENWSLPPALDMDKKNEMQPKI